jgi:hypothetical protein
VAITERYFKVDPLETQRAVEQMNGFIDYVQVKRIIEKTSIKRSEIFEVTD